LRVCGRNSEVRQRMQAEKNGASHNAVVMTGPVANDTSTSAALHFCALFSTATRV
jgi:hypothetical protein